MRSIKIKFFNLYTTVKDILYNWWVIALSVLIGAMGCFVYYTVFLQREYTSSMTIAVNISGYTTTATASTISRTIEIAQSFEKILQSDALIEIVEKDINEEFTGRVWATQKEETNLIDIYVTDSSPDKAYRTLNSLYSNYHLLTDSSFNNVIIAPISNPGMASSISNRNTIIRNSIVYGILAAIICTLIIVILSYFRDTVKNPSDVEELLDGKLFGVVHHVNKKKSHVEKVNDGLLLTNPLIDSQFVKDFEDMSVKLESFHNTRGVRSVIITSIAENEGKTTTSVNLAIALAAAGKKVVLVDADLKMPAVYKFFDKINYEYKNELGEYLKGNIDSSDLLLHDKYTNVYLIGGKKQQRNSAEMVAGDRFKELIKALEQNFDIVLVDTPPGGIAIDAEIVSEQLSGILLVVRQDFAYVEIINDYITNISDDKKLGFIFNDLNEFGVKRKREE